LRANPDIIAGSGGGNLPQRARRSQRTTEQLLSGGHPGTPGTL